MAQAQTADDVWRLLGELAEAQKKTERRFQETDRLFQEAEHRFQETERLLKEQTQKTERLLKEQSQESDRRFQETDRFLKEQARQLNKQIGNLGNRLGEFVEWQVRPAVVRLFRERNIDVHELYADVFVEKAAGAIQIDLLVVNETDVILVEVKSKLSQTDVDEHIERLNQFKQLMPRYAQMNAMAAVAAMVILPDIARYAYRRGVFVLAQSGDGVVILNDDKFQPRMW